MGEQQTLGDGSWQHGALHRRIVWSFSLGNSRENSTWITRSNAQPSQLAYDVQPLLRPVREAPAST